MPGRGEKPAVEVPPGAHENCNIGGHFHSLVSVIYHGIFPGGGELPTVEVPPEAHNNCSTYCIEFNIFISELCARWRRTAVSWSPT